jgi:ribosome-binding protein aMBF1 (putative translation factor)
MAKSKVTGNRVGKGSVKASRTMRDTKAGQFLSLRHDSGPVKGINKSTDTAGVAAKQSKTNPAAGADLLVGTRYLSSDGLVDVERVTELFGMTKASLAQTLGFADDTLQRFSRAAAPKTQQRLREMLEILTRVERWAGGMPQALGWYRGQGIPALGDQTAEALVKSDQAVIVRRYLDGLAAGSFA